MLKRFLALSQCYDKSTFTKIKDTLRDPLFYLNVALCLGARRHYIQTQVKIQGPVAQK